MTTDIGTQESPVKFCLDRLNFNSAQNYLQIDPSGEITVLVSGVYNIVTDIPGNEALVVNGVNRSYRDLLMIDGLVPLWEGDVFFWQIPQIISGPRQKIQIEYIGAHNFPDPRTVPAP